MGPRSIPSRGIDFHVFRTEVSRMLNPSARAYEEKRLINGEACFLYDAPYPFTQSQIRDLQVYSAEEWDRRRRLSKQTPGRGPPCGVRKGANTRRKLKTGSKPGTVVNVQLFLGDIGPQGQLLPEYRTSASESSTPEPEHPRTRQQQIPAAPRLQDPIPPPPPPPPRAAHPRYNNNEPFVSAAAPNLPLHRPHPRIAGFNYFPAGYDKAPKPCSTAAPSFPRTVCNAVAPIVPAPPRWPPFQELMYSTTPPTSPRYPACMHPQHSTAPPSPFLCAAPRAMPRSQQIFTPATSSPAKSTGTLAPY